MPGERFVDQEPDTLLAAEFAGALDHQVNPAVLHEALHIIPVVRDHQRRPVGAQVGQDAPGGGIYIVHVAEREGGEGFVEIALEGSTDHTPGLDGGFQLEPVAGAAGNVVAGLVQRCGDFLSGGQMVGGGEIVGLMVLYFLFDQQPEGLLSLNAVFRHGLLPFPRFTYLATPGKMLPIGR